MRLAVLFSVSLSLFILFRITFFCVACVSGPVCLSSFIVNIVQRSSCRREGNSDVWTRHCFLLYDKQNGCLIYGIDISLWHDPCFFCVLEGRRIIEFKTQESRRSLQQLDFPSVILCSSSELDNRECLPDLFNVTGRRRWSKWLDSEFPD